MTDANPAEFFYRLPATTTGNRPGGHHSRSRGAGMNFVAHARLLDQPDPRRLDLRASISNLHREWQVRVNQHRAAIEIVTIVDTSQNMQFGATRKIDIAADFLAALGFSAGSYGDAVGLLAFDSHAREDLSMPLRYGRGAGALMSQLIQTSRPSKTCVGSASASALAECVAQASARARMVFICSDFHWPVDNLASLLDPLAGALVVPLVIWDPAEVTPPEGRQLLSLNQLGTGTSRHLWLNAKLRKKWRDNIAARRTEIIEAFAPIDSTPFFISGGFDAEALSRYFMEQGA